MWGRKQREEELLGIDRRVSECEWVDGWEVAKLLRTEGEGEGKGREGR